MTPTPAVLAVALYAALNGLIFMWLTAHVGKVRGQRKISIGDGGDPLMIRAMRGQANFVEAVPLTLLLLLLAALIGTPAWLLHILGAALTLGRVFHGLHFTAEDAPGWQRAAGASLTLLTTLVVSLGLLGHVLWLMVMA